MTGAPGRNSPGSQSGSEEGQMKKGKGYGKGGGTRK